MLANPVAFRFLMSIEADRWSTIDSEIHIRNAISMLSPENGQLLFVSPYPLADMREAGWDAAQFLLEAGCAIEEQGSLGERGDFIVARRR